MIRTLRLTRRAAFGLIVLLSLGAAILMVRSGGRPAGPGRSVSEGIPIGGPFHLIDSRGRPVTDADYRGRWMLVFFGYTNCPDECPLTLQMVAATLQKLRPLAGRIAPLFITVDPTRDTPARLAGYLPDFDPRIIGLTGRDAQIAAVAKAYRVYYSSAEHEKSGADVINHSIFLYLMTPEGAFDTVFPADIDAKALTAALRAKIGHEHG